jgi:hypothetical protein
VDSPTQVSGISSPSFRATDVFSGQHLDNLPTLVQLSSSELRDELDRYLSTDPEHTEDVLAWWHKRRASFPRLSRMALNYLTIPGEQFRLPDTGQWLTLVVKQRPLTSNAPSARDAYSSPTHAAVYWPKQLVASCAWDHGVGSAW